MKRFDHVDFLLALQRSSESWRQEPLPCDNPDSEDHARYHTALNRIGMTFLVVLMVFLSSVMPENFQGFSWKGPAVFLYILVGLSFARAVHLLFDELFAEAITNLTDYFRGY